MKRVFLIFLIMVFAGSLAVSEVLIPGWWDASLDDLQMARELVDAALNGKEVQENIPSEVIIFADNWRTESAEALNNALTQIDSQIIAMGGSIGTPIPTWTPTPTWTPIPASNLTPTPMVVWTPVPVYEGLLAENYRNPSPTPASTNTPKKKSSGKSKAQVIQELGNDFIQETDGKFEYLIFQRQQFGFEWDMLYRFLDDDLSKVSYIRLNNDVKSMLTDFDILCVQLEKFYGPNEILGKTTEKEVNSLIQANLGKSKLLISARYKGNNNTFILLLVYYHRNKIITSLEYRKERYDYNNNGLDVFLRKFGEEYIDQEVEANKRAENSFSHGTVNANQVNVRKKPDKGSDIIAKLGRGTEVEIIGQTENAKGETWYNIRTNNGREGFIAGEYVALGGSGEEINPKVSNLSLYTTPKMGLRFYIPPRVTVKYSDGSIQKEPTWYWSTENGAFLIIEIETDLSNAIGSFAVDYYLQETLSDTIKGRGYSILFDSPKKLQSKSKTVSAYYSIGVLNENNVDVRSGMMLIATEKGICLVNYLKSISDKRQFVEEFMSICSEL